MKQLGFYYDPSLCIGCRACQVACKEEHKLPSGDFFRRVEALETEDKWQFFSGACNHCDNAACLSACPTGALYRAEDGTVQHRDDLCIGCGRCRSSCPYGAISLSRITGYAQKCDGCAARRAAGKNPACVDACPVRALHFGPMHELKEKFGSCGASLPFLPDPAVTSPNLLICGSPQVVLPPPETVPAEAPMPLSDSEANIVILGSGAAAVSAAKAIRAHAPKAKITMISREARLPYSRPMLSKGLLDSFALDRYPIVDAGWLAAHVESIRASVTAIDPQGHTVTLADGRKIPYDKCIYALGMDCFVPPIEGRELPGVYTLRSDTDLHDLRKAMLTAQKAVVIGGGITGLELAWEMKKAGLEVVVLDMVDQLLGRILDSHTAEMLQTAIEQKGICIDTGVQVAAITGETHTQAVCLADGKRYDADLVVLSTGYRANTALAQAAGLETGRAVMVDDRLFTSHPDILTCGDCASSSTATWLQSIEQGRIAGLNALGCELKYKAETEPAMIHTADTSLMVAGDMGKGEGRTYTYVYGQIDAAQGRFYVDPRPEGRLGTHLTLCLLEGRIVGVALLGDLAPMQLAEQAVHSGWTFDQLRNAAMEKGVVIHER